MASASVVVIASASKDSGTIVVMASASVVVMASASEDGSKDVVVHGQHGSQERSLHTHTAILAAILAITSNYANTNTTPGRDFENGFLD